MNNKSFSTQMLFLDIDIPANQQKYLWRLRILKNLVPSI